MRGVIKAFHSQNGRGDRRLYYGLKGKFSRFRYRLGSAKLMLRTHHNKALVVLLTYDYYCHYYYASIDAEKEIINTR
jgi:hypothetical protein